MEEKTKVTVEHYLDIANSMLEKKDLLGFVENISYATLSSQNDEQMLAQTTLLRVKGLMKLNQHTKALEAIKVALKYNTSEDSIYQLKKYQGRAKGYLGYINEALQSFKELLSDAKDVEQETVICLYIAWVILTLDQDKDPDRLTEAKKYLDLAKGHFDKVADSYKWRICNNYSIYHYYQQDYDQAIESLESALNYCEEKDLPYIYDNLAEVYLAMETEHISYAQLIQDYTEKAEIIGTRYKDDIAMGRAFYLKAMSEMREGSMFRALDSLYLSLEYYRQAEAYSLAFECLVKIYHIIDEYKIERLEHLKDSLKKMFISTPFKKEVF